MASRGHLHPLVPLVRALFDEGHEVDVATGSGEPRGGGVAALASASRELLDDLMARRPVADLVVHEEGEWAAPVYAAITGVPSVAVGWGAPLPAAEMLRAIDVAARPLWEAHGVVARSPAGLFDHRFLDTCPPALQRLGLPGVVEPMRWEPLEPPPAGASRTDVYVTLGTVSVFNRAPDLLATIVRALPDEPLVVTTGPGHRPVLPPHRSLRVAEYVAQSQVLARSKVVITHGGAGSTLGALAEGLPVLVLPRGAPSQRRMADACAAAGVGIALDEPDAGSVREAVRALLGDSMYRGRAGAVAAELAALPSPRDIVRCL
jgi:UDP:flavonoid glycosyltransferase YjiC (YdhE family)